MTVIKIKTPTGWRDLTIEPTGSIQIPPKIALGTTGFAFQNSWRQYAGGGAWTPAGLRKFPDGRVVWEGLIDHSGLNWIPTEIIANVPVGYRPTINKIYELAGSGGAGAGVVQVRIETDGNLRIGDHGASANPVTWLSLSGIEYDTGQVDWPVGAINQPATDLQVFMGAGIGDVAFTVDDTLLFLRKGNPATTAFYMEVPNTSTVDQTWEVAGGFLARGTSAIWANVLGVVVMTSNANETIITQGKEDRAPLHNAFSWRAFQCPPSNFVVPAGTTRRFHLTAMKWNSVGAGVNYYNSGIGEGINPWIRARRLS